MGLLKVPAENLFVSEPDPLLFGNDENAENDPTWTNGNWLKSRFHFSFAEYHDPQRSQYGVLRVMNDDLVQPNRGFGTHGHRNMEIVTYVVEGALTHQDSMGTAETLERGSVQFMTAGTGVRHSEHNRDKARPLRFIQIWINPVQLGLQPNYGSLRGSLDQRHNKLAHLVSPVDKLNKMGEAGEIKINQDAHIYVAELDTGRQVALSLSEGRMAYVLCVEGALSMEGPFGKESLTKHDAARVDGSGAITFSALENEDKEPGHVLIVEMAQK